MHGRIIDPDEKLILCHDFEFLFLLNNKLNFRKLKGKSKVIAILLGGLDQINSLNVSYILSIK